MYFTNSAKYGVGQLNNNGESILLVISMPVPWEALIPFGKLASLSLLSSAEFTRSGHRIVWRCWNTVECVQTRTKPGQSESSISISFILSHMCLTPAAEIPYRFLGGDVDG